MAHSASLTIEREYRQTIATIQRVNDHRRAGARTSGSIFVLGGNDSTLAFTASLRADQPSVEIYLLPLARTPAGIFVGSRRRRVAIPADEMLGWLDRTFTSDDPHSFMSPVRDIELLVRTNWHAPLPEAFTEDDLLNAEDLPGELLDALSLPPASLVECATCRRLCVCDAFVWNERRLCAWDYHTAVFGRRGPWRNAPYEERLFETLPRAAYAFPPLLDSLGVDTILSVGGLPEAALRLLVNTAIAQVPGMPYLAVRTDEGLMLLRERGNTKP